MELLAITACKLYKTSSRKNKILANASKICSTNGLPIQEISQVNKSSLPKHTVASPSLESDKQNAKTSQSNVQSTPKQRNSNVNVSVSSAPSHTTPRAHAGSEANIKSPEQQDANDLQDIPSDKSNYAPNDLTNTAAHESSNNDVTSNEAVECSTGVSLPRIDVTERMDVEVEDIKGILNADLSTCGVTRVRSKDDEVWVYYNDSVNLNDVMVNAIELLNRPGYTYLEFNRLARSDNAIVFVIIKDDTAREKKPESEVKSKE